MAQSIPTIVKTSVVDPDPHGSVTYVWIQIRQKVKEHINKTVNSGLFVLLDSSIVLNREWQIVVKMILLNLIYRAFLYYFEIYLINIGWIRIRMDPELLPESGSGTWKIESWIQIRNKSLRIHNTGKNS